MTQKLQVKLIDAINGLEDLSVKEKRIWSERIQKEGVTGSLKQDLYAMLKQKDDEDFAELGIAIDENDPEYKHAVKEATAEAVHAEADFKKEIAHLQKEIEHVQKAATKDMDVAWYRIREIGLKRSRRENSNAI